MSGGAGDTIDAFVVSVIGAVTVTVALTVARVWEIVTGHTPTPALTAAFSASVTATLALVAAGRVWRH